MSSTTVLDWAMLREISRAEAFMTSAASVTAWTLSRVRSAVSTATERASMLAVTSVAYLTILVRRPARSKIGL
jgi:hypothetical protein